ncbi:hypothetical protein [Aureispira anguillae]|uniref:Uncharacterized protein n=1 Tax=Aureispira anguillae TaxID=2864201 RepID=A0A915YDZ4_9BACT|nr:hypothetical protein [Aureispira anguillae]BDS11354.1 hypothetical protein AsAng_0020660 [Aureispira anguillae]
MKDPVWISPKFLKNKFIVDVALINQLKVIPKNEAKNEDGDSISEP